MCLSNKGREATVREGEKRTSERLPGNK